MKGLIFMAVRFDFTLGDSDFNKLRLLKRADGESDMTFNDYAEELLSRTIRRMYREYCCRIQGPCTE